MFYKSILFFLKEVCLIFERIGILSRNLSLLGFELWSLDLHWLHICTTFFSCEIKKKTHHVDAITNFQSLHFTIDNFSLINGEIITFLSFLNRIFNEYFIDWSLTKWALIVNLQKKRLQIPELIKSPIYLCNTLKIKHQIKLTFLELIVDF